jgi:hypothetical protein
MTARTAREELVHDHYVDGIIERSDFLPAKAALDERVARAEAALARLRRRELLVDLAPGQTVGQAWVARGPGWCRALAAAHIERVVIHPAPRRGSKIVDPSRVEVVWRQ